MNVMRVAMAVALLFSLTNGESAVAQEINRYVRYTHNDSVAYGILDGDQVRVLDGAPWNDGKPTGAVSPAGDVVLLAPAEPSKVIAVGYNYVSHREDMTHEESRPIPEHPPLFLKLPTAITGPDTDIYVTLLPGDLIYTGTPGATSAMKPGDVVEVEVEGVGILKNHVVAGKL